MVDGSVVVWGCFAAEGAGRLDIIIGPMSSVLYEKKRECVVIYLWAEPEVYFG